MEKEVAREKVVNSPWSVLRGYIGAGVAIWKSNCICMTLTSHVLEEYEDFLTVFDEQEVYKMLI